jgi:hypothetical protein
LTKYTPKILKIRDGRIVKWELQNLF